MSLQPDIAIAADGDGLSAAEIADAVAGRSMSALRVTDESEHVILPLALKEPVACQFALAPDFTFATAATPSPTLFPDESLNCT